MEKEPWSQTWEKEITLKNLKAGNFLYGEQAGYAKFLIQKIKEEARDKGEEIQIKSYFLFETSWPEILDEASNLDIFSSAQKKIFIIYFPDYEGDDQQAGERAFRQYVSSDESAIERYFSSPPSNVFLIISYPGKLRKGQKLLEFFSGLGKKFKGHFEAKELKTPRWTEILSWIEGEAGRRGKSISREAAKQLLEISGPDLSILRQELEKLCLYAAEKAEISPEDILTVCAWQKTYDRFAIEEALESGTLEEGLNISGRFFSEQPEAWEVINFFGCISRYILALNQAKREVEKFKVPVKEVFKKLHPQIIEGWSLFERKLKAFENCLKAFSQKDLDDLVAELVRVDLKLKSSDLDPRVLIETFLVYYFQLRDKKKTA
ncbi:MAG: DNA polymerase III subunit delta [Candidatus Saccharicenans sp.]